MQPDEQKFDASDAIRELMPLITASVGPQVQVDFDLSPESCRIIADKAGFSQAVSEAQRQLDDDRFIMAIDVRRARMQKIRPLATTTAPEPTALSSDVFETRPSQQRRAWPSPYDHVRSGGQRSR